MLRTPHEPHLPLLTLRTAKIPSRNCHWHVTQAPVGMVGCDAMGAKDVLHSRPWLRVPFMAPCSWTDSNTRGDRIGDFPSE